MNDKDMEAEIRLVVHDFAEEMLQAMLDSMKVMGLSWRESYEGWFLEKIRVNIANKKWVNVANYAMMLRDNEKRKSG